MWIMLKVRVHECPSVVGKEKYIVKPMRIHKNSVIPHLQDKPLLNVG